MLLFFLVQSQNERIDDRNGGITHVNFSII